MRRIMLAAMVTGCVWTSAEAAAPSKPAAMQVEGVPELDAEVVARLNQYQQIRTASFAGWAPDGHGMLVGTRFGNTTQLHQVYVPGGRREQLTYFDEPAGGRFIPSGDEGDLLVVMSAGGNENYQIYRFDRATGRTTLLTDGESRNRMGPVRDDGQRMVVHSNRRNGRDTDIYLADCATPGPMELLKETEGEFWIVTDMSPDGGRLLMRRYVSINESYPAVFDVAAKRTMPIPIPRHGTATEGIKVAYGTLAFAGDGRHAYVTTDARGEFMELARLELDGGEYEWLSEDISWNVGSVEVDRERGRVAFTVNADGASDLYVLENGERRKLDVPLAVVSGLEFSSDGEHLGFTLSRPDAPSDAYSIDLDSGEMTRWTYSEVGGLDAETFISPERISFRTFDERKIPAYYYRPRGASESKPVPVLINIHGGPEGQYRPFFSGITQYYLNELGFAVIAPNVRGSAGYGKSYLLLDNGPQREDTIRDIGGLLDWVAGQPELDASRVAVAGGSYGGYMVLGSLVMHGERIRAGIDRVGIANFISFLERTSPYRQDLRRAEYGDERDPEMRTVFERINPTSNAEKIRSALLVEHGTNDPRVPFFEAEQIVEKVRSNGRTVWSIYADNEGHGFRKKDNRDYATAVEAMFLREYLAAP